jgi:hypothetical protein
VKEKTLLLVVYRERETIDTTGEAVQEPIRHLPITVRPTVHKAMPEAFVQFARWVAQ